MLNVLSLYHPGPVQGLVNRNLGPYKTNSKGTL